MLYSLTVCHRYTRTLCQCGDHRGQGERRKGGRRIPAALAAWVEEMGGREGETGRMGGGRGGETTSHSHTVLQILSKTLMPLRLSLTISSSMAVKNPICASGVDAQQALSRALFCTISSVSLPP